jgi:hypothetical protein
VRTAGFRGTVQYALRSAPTVPLAAASLDQMASGDYVTVNTDVTVYASGLRNSYDHVFTTTGKTFATDNGPNTGFGLASLGPTTSSTADANSGDELLDIVQGAYYGHPNRNRGVTAARENVYHSRTDPLQAPPADFTQSKAQLAASSNGIVEFRSRVFQGTLAGSLVIGRYGSDTVAVDATTFTVTTISTTLQALDVEQGPAGVIFGAGYGANAVTLIVPQRTAPVGLVAWDIFPWRCQAVVATGVPFLLSGAGFGTSAAAVTITFGGVPATQLTSVANGRISGVIPQASAALVGQLVDIVVVVGAQSATLPAAFMFLGA